MGSKLESKKHDSIPAMHPGELLREDTLPALGKSASEAAADLGMSEADLQTVLDEHAPVTAELAMKLGQYLGSRAEFWMDLQGRFDLWKARKTVDVSNIKRVEAAE